MKIFLGAFVVIILILGAWLLVAHKAVAPTGAPVTQATQSAVSEYKNATYTIDGQPVTLVNGYSEVASAPGSVSKTITKFFGNEATGDLNGDGIPDTAFLLTQTGGGSGTFYYVVVALKAANGYTGTNAVLLGDRIAPQTTQIEYGEVVVNYADREPSEPMTMKPSVGMSKYLRVEKGMLSEIPASEYAAGNLLLGTNASKTLGTYIIGSNSMTLYVYAKDSVGVSDCTGTCADVWPPYIVPNAAVLANVQAGISGKVATLTRANGSLEVTYNGAPLYFYKSDTKSGDTTGQGVGGTWSVAKP
jgi:predicted lipoprotein with Yx(FWY)xxD motif